MDSFEWIALAAKAGFIVVVMLQVVPIMVWLERRGSALIQNRLGPNRVGPLGLLQSLADVVKFIFKEDRIPGHVNAFYWFIAPLICLLPAFMSFAVVPFASSISIDGRLVEFQIAKLDMGLLYIFAINSLSVFGIIMACWASNNKYALLGGIRSTAQMISYELTLGLSVVGLLMIFSSFNLMEIVRLQGETFFQIGPIAVPKWGIFVQPLGFLLFLTASYAETNRLPFDLPEGESEIVAGYHLEYGAMKFALFFMAEYLHMFTASALVVTLFFGGWQLLPGMNMLIDWVGLEGMAREWLRVVLELSSFFIKVGFFMWLYIWVRWTLPRFRFDQVMYLGWRVMFPLVLINIFVTGVLIYLGVF